MTKTIARHTLCGLFDAVKERRSDLALADLSSDAFRKQFSKAEVTSDRQDGVLVALPGAGAVHHARDPRGKPHPVPEAEEQGVAQLLAQDDEILVCSYLLRTAGQY